MSKGRYNSSQSLLRRRKGALVRRQANVDHYNKSISLGLPTAPLSLEALPAKIEKALAEIAILKSRTGVSI